MATIIGTGGDDFRTGTSGDDTLQGLAGNDTLEGVGGADLLEGGDNYDVLDGGQGDDTLAGGSGIDTARYDFGDASAGVLLDGGSTGAGPVDIGDGLGGVDRLDSIEQLTVYGSSFDDKLIGGVGNDLLWSGDGNDTIRGGAGTDRLYGGGGNDSVLGDEGDDWLYGESGNDTLSGGDGYDWLQYSFMYLPTGVSIDGSAVGVAAPAFIDNGRGGTDRVEGIEVLVLYGSAHADTLVGGAGNDLLDGGSGADSLVGGAGTDRLYGGEGDDTLAGGAGDDTYRYFVKVSGDTVIGTDGFDTIVNDDGTGAGLDRLVFEGLAIDHVYGYWQGNDLNLTVQPTTDWPEPPVSPPVGGVVLKDLWSGNAANLVDRLEFSDVYGLLSYAGGGLNIAIYDWSNALLLNLIWGNAGNDTLTGGAGDDELQGEGGNDLLQGLSGNDSLQGGAGNDTLVGGGDNDYVDGEDGTDVADYRSAGSPVTVNLLTGSATGSAIGTDTLNSVEAAQGSSFDDFITLGNAVGGFAFGRAGNDSLVGGTADDGFWGGSGNDTLVGGAGFDTAQYGDDGNDAAGPIKQGIAVDLPGGKIVDGWGNTDSVSSIEYVRGTPFADTFVGDGADNIFWGDGGDDTLNGGAGGDMAHYGNATGPVTVNLALGKASGADGNDTLISIEYASGSSFADTLIGDATGNFLRGRAGDDTIDGGAGSDRAAYDSAGSGVTVDLVAGTSSGGDGNDKLLNIENLRGSGFDDKLTGNDDANDIQARAGNDTVYGGGGGDTLFGEDGSDVLYGGAGGDTLDGGNGSDQLHGEDGADSLAGGAGNDSLYGGGGDDTLTGGAGDDTLDGGDEASGDGLTHYDRVSYATASGPVKVNLALGTAGGDGTDVLIDLEGVLGSPFADTITGSGGDDLLAGNGGDDVVDGGDGYDLFDFGTATGAVIASLATGKASGADGADTLANIEGLLGTAFDDRLTGDGADNFLRGNAGNDTLDGGAGSDRADYRTATGAVFVNLVAGLSTGAAGSDLLTNIENLRGSESFGDVLIGAAGINSLQGRGGNDLLIGLGDDDALDGGSGADAARYLGSRAAYTVSASGGTITVAHANATDTLTAVERLQFADLDVVFDVDGTPGQAYRLYQAAFDRTPDTSGLSFWIRQMDAGATLLTVAEQFLASPEFQSKYGANPTNEAFIDLLYQNVLDRLPDQGGYDFWIDAFNRGLTRAGALVEFSESAENKANLLPVLSNGITYAPLAAQTGGGGNDALSGTAGADWLRSGAGRDLLNGLAGDDRLDGGADLDTAAFSGARGQYTVVGDAAAMMVIDNSGVDGIDNLLAVERLAFADKNLAFDIDGNAGQAYRLYQAAFDRVPDIAGLSFWIDAIDDGAALLQVAEAFIGSPEFQSKYGANPSNEAFIALLYQNVLDRLPDQAGYDFWLDAFSRGLSRAGALVEFSESAENQADLIGVLQQGIEYLPLG